MRMRNIVICALPRSTVFSPHYLINGAIFGKTLLNTKCVFWFSVQLLSETFLILRRTERDMIKNVYRSAGKVPVIVVRYQWKLNFLDRFSKNIKISNFMKIFWVGTKLFNAGRRTDGRTNMTKLMLRKRLRMPQRKLPLYNRSIKMHLYYDQKRSNKGYYFMFMVPFIVIYSMK